MSTTMESAGDIKLTIHCSVVMDNELNAESYNCTIFSLHPIVDIVAQ